LAGMGGNPVPVWVCPSGVSPLPYYGALLGADGHPLPKCDYVGGVPQHPATGACAAVQVMTTMSNACVGDAPSSVIYVVEARLLPVGTGTNIGTGCPGGCATGGGGHPVTGP